MTRDRRDRGKRSKKGWLFIGFLSAGAVIFHQPLLLLGCKLALKKAIPAVNGRIVSYESMQWENGAIAISSLLVKDSGCEWTADRIEVKLSGDFFGLRFAPDLTVVHPQILLSSSDSKGAAAPAFLVRTRFFQPRWTIKNGVLQLPSTSRFYFSMTPGSEKESIGSLHFSYDPDPLVTPLFAAELAMADKSLQVGFHLKESDLSRLIPLTALLFSDVNRDWDNVSGEVELEGLIFLGREGEIEELHMHGSGKEIALIGPKMGINVNCDEMQASFSYPASDSQGFFWDKLSASLLLKNADCILGAPLFGHAFGLKNCNGQISIDALKEPQITLSGDLVQEQREIAFSLSGQGGLQEDSTFWSEIALDFTASLGSKMQTLFSLFSHEEGDLAIHMKVEDAGYEHLDFFRAFSGIAGQCVQGVASGEAILVYKDGKCQTIRVENCLLDKMCWHLPNQSTLFSDQITADCAFVRKQQWEIDDLRLQMDGGDYVDPRLHVDLMAATIAIDQGVLQTSSFKGQWGQLGAEIAFLGPQSDHIADLKLEGDAGALLELLAISANLPISLQIAAKMDRGSLMLEGEGNVSGEAIKGSASLTADHLTLLEVLSGHFPAFRFKEGTFSAERLTQKSYAAFVPLMLPLSELWGDLHCEAVFSPSRIQVSIDGEELQLLHPLAQIHVPQMREEPAQFIYDVPSKQWHGEIPLTESRLYYKDLNVTFDHIESSLQLEGGCLKAPSFYAECAGLALRGSIELDPSQQLSVTTSQIAGDVQSLLGVLGKFPSFPKEGFPIHGNFSSGEKGLIFKMPLNSKEESAEVSFKGHFESLTFPVNPSTSIREASCDVLFDSKSNLIHVEKAEGIWELMDGTPLTVQIKRLSTLLSDNPTLEFALKVAQGKKEFAQIEGIATKNPSSGWTIVFEPQATHFGGAQLNITQCILNNDKSLASFEMKPILRAQDLHSQAAFLQNAGFLSQAFSPKNLQEWELEGTLQAQLFSKEMAKGCVFAAESSDFKVKGQSWPSFRIQGQKRGEKWQIEKLEAKGMFFKGAFAADADGLTFPGFEGTWNGLALKGNGYVKTEKKRFFCTLESLKGDLSALPILLTSPKGNFIAGVALAGDFSDPNDPLKITGEANLFVELQSPLPIHASSIKAVKFSYGKENGFVFSGIDFQLKHKVSGASLADFKADKVIQKADLSVQQIQLSLSPALLGHAIDAKMIPASLQPLEWEGNLEGSGDLQIGASGMTFQGNLKPGRYGFSGKNIPFEQLQLRYENAILSIRAKAQYEEQPLWASFQLDLAKEPYGMLKLFDHPKAEGMKILFSTQSSKVILESVQGSCYGLTCSLAKSSKRKVPLAHVLTGEIQVDANALTELLPKEVREGMQNLKIGSGYRWQGDVVLWQEANKGFLMNGTVTGKDFELLGYSFRSLKGTLEANPEHVVLSSVQIEDPAGAIEIKKIELNNREGWHLVIPHILVHHLQPSLMHKVGSEQSPVKPFTIKNLTLTDIRGRLGDTSSLEGSGYLMFVNQFKKESSIFDIPLEMIKKIGLDLGLLTPVQGELRLELHGDKFYLISLDNAFSDGDRSEFYLSPGKDLSYIDLDGKMHIDLRMRQDVVLKITEPFTLTIRGTLDKPRYGLQF